MKFPIWLLTTMSLVLVTFAQSKDDYSISKNTTTSKNLLDPSKFTIHNSVGFGAGVSNMSSIQSQGLYSTMMQYKFAAPVTLNLNFGLPIFSTLSSAQNLTSENVQSLEYFKNMPFDVSLTWKPTSNTLMRFSVEKQTDNYFGYNSPLNYDLFGDRISSSRREVGYNLSK